MSDIYIGHILDFTSLLTYSPIFSVDYICFLGVFFHCYLAAFYANDPRVFIFFASQLSGVNAFKFRLKTERDDILIFVNHK